jgi:hypothetical protein
MYLSNVSIALKKLCQKECYGRCYFHCIGKTSIPDTRYNMYIDEHYRYTNTSSYVDLMYLLITIISVYMYANVGHYVHADCRFNKTSVECYPAST